MIYIYRNVKIFYKFTNRKKCVTNIFLHGWGCDHSKLRALDQFLEGQNSLFVDLPPFGKSGQNLKGWSVFTYANMVIGLCEKLGIKGFNLIGHSFGGRICILLATLCKEQTEKLVLIDSAGVKPKRSMKYYFNVFRYKLRKRFNLDVSNFGSADYKALASEQRAVFSNIVNTHLDEFLPLIYANTLIIFGENDKTTPIYMAKKLNRKIKNSKLVILHGCGHFCVEEKKLEVSLLLKNFLV